MCRVVPFLVWRSVIRCACKSTSDQSSLYCSPCRIHVWECNFKFGQVLCVIPLDYGSRYEVWQSTAASKNPDSTFSFEIGTKTMPQLRDGRHT